jgi:hypothetical protein
MDERLSLHGFKAFSLATAQRRKGRRRTSARCAVAPPRENHLLKN